jgi:hypothetical protein
MWGKKDKKAEFDLTMTTVWEWLDWFIKMMTKHIGAKPSPQRQHADLQVFVQYYISTPALEDVPLLAAQVAWI